MKQPELYHKTVGILFDAYFNDTLERQNCYACAVGNLVAANCGYTFIPSGRPHLKFDWLGVLYPGVQGWGRVFCTNEIGEQHITPSNYSGEAKSQIDSTGYAVQELAKIEKSFEKGGRRGRGSDEKMFNGLCAVLEVLKEIHEVTDEDLLTANNTRFKEQYNKRLEKV